MANEPTEQDKAQLSKDRGERASRLNFPSPEAKQKFIAAQGDAESKGKLDAPKMEMLKTEGTLSFDKGGTVPKTGVFKVRLKQGETVRTPEQEKEMQDKLKKPPAKAAEMLGGEKPKEDKSKESKGDSKSEPKGKSEGEKKHKKAKHKSTLIDHLDDGSHVVRHIPHEGSDTVSYSSPDMAGVHAGLDQHLGDGMMPEQASPVAAQPAVQAPVQV